MRSCINASLRAFFALILLSTNLSAQAQLAAQIDSLFRSDDPTSTPGCAVAIIKSGSILVKKGYGMANLDYSVPITTATIFDVASVSKQFTGLAISMLVQQGKIDLNADIRRYVPDVPDFGKTITVHHLLHHTSGLRDWYEALSYAGWREGDPILFEDVMRLVRNQKELDFIPGNQFSYTNTSYNLLAAIVEKVSGQPFAQWMKKNVFDPLQMNSSHVRDDYRRIVKNLAYPYSFDGNQFKSQLTPLTAYGSSSVFTSVDDLCKWSIHFRQQIALGNPIYTAMLTQGTLNDGAKIGYGYGLEMGDYGSSRVSYHTGSWAGYKTSITTYLDEDLTIVLLSNFDDFNPTHYASAIARYLIGSKPKPTNKPVDTVKNTPSITLPAKLATKIVGSYLLRPGKSITITLENGQLMVQATGEPTFKMEPKSDSTLWVEAYQASMRLLADKKGTINRINYKNKLLDRVTPWHPQKEGLKPFVGRYRSDELHTEYKVSLTDSLLVIDHMRHGTIPLAVDSTRRDCFRGDFGYLRFRRNSAEKVIGFEVSANALKPIQFYRKDTK